MSKLILVILTLCFVVNANADILCESPIGGSPYRPGTLAIAATSNSCRNTNVVVTSVLSAVQSNISSATVHTFGRPLEIKEGGSVNPTTKFRTSGNVTMSGGTFGGTAPIVINGPFSASNYQVFAGSGAVTGLKESRPEYFATNANPGTTNMTAAIQAAVSSLNTGGTLFITNTYLSAKITLISDLVIAGGGKIIQKTGDGNSLLYGFGLSNVTTRDITIDGGTGQSHAAGTALIDLRSCTNIRVLHNTISNAQTGAVQLQSCTTSEVGGNTITNTYANGIVAGHIGATDIYIHDNLVSGTTTQNCIFITASFGSLSTTDFIYNVRVTDNTVMDSSDSGIEIGQHTIGAVVTGNIVKNSISPGLLFRDCQKVIAANNYVEMGSTATSDAIAVVPFYEAQAWDYQLKIISNIIRGKLTRSGVYLDGSGVQVSDNDIQDTYATVGADGTGLEGVGVALGIGTNITLTGVKINNNRISSVLTGIDTNFANNTGIGYSDFSFSHNDISNVNKGINIVNGTFTDGQINGNKITQVKTTGINGSATGGIGAYLLQNILNLAGWSGASPTSMNGTFIGFSLSSSGQLATIPGTQYSAQILLPGGYGAGYYTLAFNDGSGEYAILYTWPHTGTGDGVGYTVLKSSANIYDTVAGFAGWGLTTDASGNLLLARRGTTITSPGNLIFSSTN